MNLKAQDGILDHQGRCLTQPFGEWIRATRRSARFVMSILLVPVFFGLGCSTPLVHDELQPDPAVLQREWTRSSKSDWKAGELGAEYSRPVFYQNTLIYGNQSKGVISLYPSLNQIRWRFALEEGVMSPLLVEEDTVFFGGGDGVLYALDAATGRVRWKYLLRNPIVSQPTYSGGRLFVTTSDDTIYALDAGTGEWLWHYRRRSVSQATVLGASQPQVHAGEVIVGLSDGYLVGISEVDGKLKWEKKIHRGQKFTDVDAHPLVASGKIYVPSYDGALVQLDRKTREIGWRVDAGGSNQVIIERDKIYLPSSDGFIYSIQRESGKVNWKFELDQGVPTQLVSTPEALIFGSSHRYLYVLDKATGKGRYRWDVGSGSGFSSAPIADLNSNRLYILSNAGNLYSFAMTFRDQATTPLILNNRYRFFSPI